MRTLAIGDVHGCLRALDALLEVVDPQPDDVLITLGDYVDRGLNSRGVLNRLLTLSEQCHCVHLKGNHELMMLAARESPELFREWMESGGRQTLESYGANLNRDNFEEAVPVQHWQFLSEGCVPHHETATHCYVHANVEPDRPLVDQPPDVLYWKHLEAGSWSPHNSGKTMVCGHSAQRSGRPLVLDHAICIDTWVYGEGWLTCLDVNLEIYWQANERGQTRVGNLRFRSR